MFNLVGVPSRIRREKLWHLAFANRVIDQRLSRAINWYRHNYFYVSSNHILYQLIKSLGMPDGLDDDTTVSYIYNNDKAYRKANAMGLTSERSMGRIHYGHFYGINTKEIIIQLNQYWDYAWVQSNWMNLCPVRILRHDQTHISYNLLTNNNYIDHPSLAIIEIDINLLHLMHAAWLKHHRQVKSINGGLVDNLGYFLGMYVLPNALASHLNQVIINKHVLLTDDELTDTIDYVGTSFYINNNSKVIDNDIKSTHQAMANSNFTIEKICNNIHGINQVTAFEFLDTPAMIMTKNIKWAYVLSFSRFLKHCINTPKQNGVEINQNYMNRLKNNLISLNNGRIFNDFRIKDLADIYQKEINWLLENT